MPRLFRSSIYARMKYLFSLAVAAGVAIAQESPTDMVGRHGTNRTVTPVNQVLTPYGLQVELPGLRPQAIALSPDGRLLATSGKTHEVVIIDPVSGAIRQRVSLPAETTNAPQPSVPSPNILKPDEKGQLSFTGLIFSPDGRSEEHTSELQSQ